jgi:hypothetical protein
MLNYSILYLKVIILMIHCSFLISYLNTNQDGKYFIKGIQRLDLDQTILPKNKNRSLTTWNLIDDDPTIYNVALAFIHIAFLPVISVITVPTLSRYQASLVV